MMLQVSSQAEVSSLTNIDGIVVATCSDWKHFYTVDSGLIWRYLINAHDLTHTADDIFTLKQSPSVLLGSQFAASPGIQFQIIARGQQHLFSHMKFLYHCSFRYIVRKQSNSESETIAFALSHFITIQN
jgi:hypothetical protein